MEVVAAAQKWTGQVKMTQPKKETAGFPWPVTVTREIPRTSKASSWEVWEIKVKLRVHGKGNPGEVPPVSVDVTCDVELPSEVKTKMEAMVMATWTAKLGSRQAGEWFIAPVFSWVEANYVELLQCIPVFVNRFISVNAAGANEWRYTILEPTVVEAPEEEEELTEEQMMAELARRKREIERRLKDEEEREELARQRRAEAELSGPKPKQLSKKEQQELNERKRGQGNRTAKRAPRRNKSAAGDDE
uniref:Uncharacterized protein n=1 Tax=Octactis speculum TaxID=3111310 RepID=A0A7S2BL03_9STRA